MTKQNLESQLDLCPYLLGGCQYTDDEQIENYCAINYENCPIYRTTVFNKREKDLNGRCGE